jgi:hypothetical protein
MLNVNHGLKEITHSITGGALAAQGKSKWEPQVMAKWTDIRNQGYWMPFACAKAIAATFCYPIRYALIPIFGPDFPSRCIKKDTPNYGNFRIPARIIRECTQEMQAWRGQAEAAARVPSNTERQPLTTRLPNLPAFAASALTSSQSPGLRYGEDRHRGSLSNAPGLLHQRAAYLSSRPPTQPRNSTTPEIDSSTATGIRPAPRSYPAPAIIPKGQALASLSSSPSERPSATPPNLSRSVPAPLHRLSWTAINRPSGRLSREYPPHHHRHMSVPESSATEMLSLLPSSPPRDSMFRSRKLKVPIGLGVEIPRSVAKAATIGSASTSSRSSAALLLPNSVALSIADSRLPNLNQITSPPLQRTPAELLHSETPCVTTKRPLPDDDGAHADNEAASSSLEQSPKRRCKGNNSALTQSNAAQLLMQLRVSTESEVDEGEAKTAVDDARSSSANENIDDKQDDDYVAEEEDDNDEEEEQRPSKKLKGMAAN